MGVNAVKENASQQGTTNVAPRPAHKNVRNVAYVLLHIHSQVLKRGAKNGDTHPLEKTGEQLESSLRCKSSEYDAKNTSTSANCHISL